MSLQILMASEIVITFVAFDGAFQLIGIAYMSQMISVLLCQAGAT